MSAFRLSTADLAFLILQPPSTPSIESVKTRNMLLNHMTTTCRPSFLPLVRC